MTIETVPGYSEFFNEDTPDYYELLAGVSSDYVITFCIVCNNESRMIDAGVQDKLLNFILSQASDQQLGKFLLSLDIYKKKDPNFQGTFFGSRYLLEMLSKEIKRNYSKEVKEVTREEEYRTFLAYLVIVQELNDKSAEYVETIDIETDNHYPLLWQTLINQYDFNQYPDMPIEYFKLFNLIKYMVDNHHGYLVEYLKQNGFSSIANFLGGMHSVTASTFQRNVSSQIKAYIKLKAKSPEDEVYLDSLSINNMLGNECRSRDLKKYPLYKNIYGEYSIIDHYFYCQKIFNGMFFDLYNNTTLKDSGIFKDFGMYTSIISTEVHEKMCFKGIIKNLSINKYEVMQFDNNEVSQPDTYYRHSNKIALIELKSYIFPSKYPEKPNYDSIKQYIDEKFITNERGKKKGIMQLIENIKNTFDNKYEFDTNLKKVIGKRIVVYPVICHNDVHFSMPGVSDYLTEILRLHIPENLPHKVEVKDVTLINIDKLFNFWVYGFDMRHVLESIDEYEKYKRSKKKSVRKKRHPNDLLKSYMSYDNYFMQYFHTKIMNVKPKVVSSILEATGLLQDVIDQEFE